MRNLRISVLKDLLQLGQLGVNTAKAIAVVKSGYFDKLIVDCHDGGAKLHEITDLIIGHTKILKTS